MIAIRTERGPDRRWSWLRLLVIGLSLWATMALWAFSSPPGSGPDENSHLAASWAVTHGQSTSTDTYVVPQRIWQLQCHGEPAVPHGPQRGFLPCFTPTGSVGTALIRVTNMTRLYPPGFHWLIGHFWGNDLTTSVYRMRTFVALGCTLLIMVPLVLISAIGGLGGVRTFGPPLLVSLSPLAFFLFGSVNPSSWEMAGAVCAWGCMAALVQAARRWHVVAALTGMALGVLAGVLTRPGGGLMLLAGMCLAAPIALSRIAPTAQRRRRQFWAVVTGCYLAVGAAAVAIGASGRLGLHWYNPVRTDVHSPLWHWSYDALNFGYYLAGSFTRLGWLDTPIPEIVGLIFTAIVGFLVLSAIRQGRFVVLASTLMVSFAAWFLTTAVLATGTPPDSGLQTRYVWPLYIGIPMIAALALGSRPATLGPDDTFAGQVRPLVAAGLIIASSIAFFTNVRRYTVGLEVLPVVSPDRWPPPVLTTSALLVCFPVAYVVLVFLLNAGPFTGLRPLTGRFRRPARNAAPDPAEDTPDVVAPSGDSALKTSSAEGGG